MSERAIAELFAIGHRRQAAEPGDIAPAFALPRCEWENCALRGSSRSGTAGGVLLPWTMVPLLRDRAGDMARPVPRGAGAHGALLVAISPQTVRQNDFTVTQHSLPFPLLRDEGAAVAAEFGAAYSVPAYMQGYYRSILVNIPFINAEPSWRLPVPATFVIDRSGVVQWSQGHADFRVRPEPAEVLKSLES